VQIDEIESVCMDIWPAYIKATRDAIVDADSKIAFDRFHVAQYLGKAVDQVRRQEHRQLLRQGDERMKGSKYHWLRNPSNMSWHQQRSFSALLVPVIAEDG
jgi:transposase